MTKRLIGLTLALALAGCMSGGSGAPALPLTTADRTADPACTGAWVAGVRGQVVDLEGVPVAGADVQMCTRLSDGVQLCLEPQASDAAGWYGVVVPPEGRCLSHLVVRAVRTGAAVRYGTSFLEVPLTPVYGVIDVRDDLALVAIESPSELPAMGDPESMRTVSFPSGVELDVTPSSLAVTASYDYLGAAEVPLAEAPAFADDPSLISVFAFGPELGVTPAMPFRLPERSGLADGTRVELLLVGGIYTELPDGRVIPEGRLETFGTGTVSDGQVVSDPGSELPYLTWVAYRSAAR